MNWEALGAIGEIVGAVAVIVTLGYVAVQIRQNTLSAKVLGNQLVDSSAATFNSLISQDKSTARLFRLGSQDLANLDEDERVQFHFLMYQWFDFIHRCFQQHREGNMDESQWRGVAAGVPVILAEPGIAQWWSTRQLSYSTQFVEFMERQVSETPAKIRLFTY